MLPLNWASLLPVLHRRLPWPQMPVGLLVDRIGARSILVSGLVLEATAIGAMAFTASYPALLILAVLAGLGHSVFSSCRLRHHDVVRR